MYRRTVALPVTIALCFGCVPEDPEEGVSYLLAQRLVGVLDLAYPHTDTNLDGDYSVTATSRMDFEADGEGLWEVRYVHNERGAQREELHEFPIRAFRVADDLWAIVDEEDETQMLCSRGDDLVCTDISEVVSRWVVE